jgi:hypothetical protein
LKSGRDALLALDGCQAIDFKRSDQRQLDVSRAINRKLPGQISVTKDCHSDAITGRQSVSPSISRGTCERHCAGKERLDQNDRSQNQAPSLVVAPTPCVKSSRFDIQWRASPPKG